MPIIKSAQKRMRQTIVKTARNMNIKRKYRAFIRETKKLIEAGEKSKIASVFSAAYKAIDMAAKKNIIHKNNAARKKSALAKMVASGKVKTATTKAEKTTAKAKKAKTAEKK